MKAFLTGMSTYQPGKPPSVFAAWGWTEAQVAMAGLKATKGPITRDSYEAALNSLTNLTTLGGMINYSGTSTAASRTCSWSRRKGASGYRWRADRRCYQRAQRPRS